MALIYNVEDPCKGERFPKMATRRANTSELHMHEAVFENVATHYEESHITSSLEIFPHYTVEGLYMSNMTHVVLYGCINCPS